MTQPLGVGLPPVVTPYNVHNPVSAANNRTTVVALSALSMLASYFFLGPVGGTLLSVVILIVGYCMMDNPQGNSQSSSPSFVPLWLYNLNPFVSRQTPVFQGRGMAGAHAIPEQRHAAPNLPPPAPPPPVVRAVPGLRYAAPNPPAAVFVPLPQQPNLPPPAPPPPVVHAVPGLRYAAPNPPAAVFVPLPQQPNLPPPAPPPPVVHVVPGQRYAAPNPPAPVFVPPPQQLNLPPPAPLPPVAYAVPGQRQSPGAQRGGGAGNAAAARANPAVPGGARAVPGRRGP